VTSTSRQQPRDGPYGESCTHWQVRMFFDGMNLGGVGAPAAQLHDSGLNQLEAAKNPAICGALSVIAEVCHHRVPARR
jgi:hypothetical protein